MSLAADAEYRLREIVQDALNFKRHSRRRKLTTSDINYALRVRNVEPLYGFSFPDPVEVSQKTDANGSSVFVLEDKEMDFDEILKAPLPKAPLEVTFRAHWLAIEGVQPLIPENPLPDGMDAMGTSKKRKAADSVDGTDKDPTVQEVLSQELQLYYENITSAVLQGSPHLLSAALQSLRSDPGLQALLPYLTHFITDEVRRSLKDLPILNALLSMTAAMLSNKQLHVEPHLHLLMPAVMTCIVGKQLCKSNLENHWALRDRAARLLTLICQRYSSPYSTLQQRVTATLMHAFLDAAKPLTTNYGATVGLSALGAQTMKQLVVPNSSPVCAVLHEKIFAVKKVGNGKGVVLGMLQTADGKPVGKDGAKDDDRACLVVEAKGVPKEGHEVWQEKSALKRMEAVRLRGALLDAVGTCIYLEAKARIGGPLPQQPLQAGASPAGAAASPASAVAAASGGGGDAYDQVCGEMGDMLLPFYADMSQPICQHFL
eukprot:Tamp_03243.p2 GENE.Tamp_03243~~Tamp_03243.p2  ORF type:complete len:526 (+),score=156.94 Tamp_03243:120-1580(+)